MAQYKTEELTKWALEAIDKYKLIFFEEIAAYLPCSRATLYNHGLDKLDEIRHAITDNQIRTKAALRAKWYNSNNATLQLCLYRLISTEDEHRRLNNTLTLSPSENEDEQEFRRPTIIVQKPSQKQLDNIEDAKEV